MRKNGWATPAWDADSGVGYTCGQQIGQRMLDEPANKHGRTPVRFDLSFDRDIRVAPSNRQGDDVAD
jgi:hypothetical protein